MRAHSRPRPRTRSAWSARRSCAGRQVTANGFARDGRVTMLGTVDSIMYPGTDQFQRFQYPSSLPRASARARRRARRRACSRAWASRTACSTSRCASTRPRGAPRVIEINPRAAGQFYDLFERVDGYSLFDAMLDLHCGRGAASCAAAQGRDAPCGELRAARPRGRGPLALAVGAREIARAAGAQPRRARDGLSASAAPTSRAR